MHTDIFDFEFSAGSALDVGILRDSNQDRVISCPEIGFFAVSDGMGGLARGGETSEIIAEVMPGVVAEIARELKGAKGGKDAKDAKGATANPNRYGNILGERVRIVSDNIFDAVNTGYIGFGATLSCVWLVGNAAVYVNLGDSRGYLLPRYRWSVRQVTDDHNVAGELVRLGEITKEEAQHHPASSRLTQFMGMPAPALPDVFVVPVTPGDRILVCSDGLHGMLNDREIRRGLRSSKWPNSVGKNLVDAANKAGGNDNISAVYIKIGAEKQ